jgi:hypothetical protein
LVARAGLAKATKNAAVKRTAEMRLHFMVLLLKIHREPLPRRH